MKIVKTYVRQNMNEIKVRKNYRKRKKRTKNSNT